MKLKTNKTFTKGSRQKIRNQKNKDWSWNINNNEGLAVIFRGGERKEGNKKERFICNKLEHYQWHVLHQQKENRQSFQRHDERAILKVRKRSRIAQSAMTPPTCLYGVVRLSFFACFILIFSQIINFPWFNMLI